MCLSTGRQFSQQREGIEKHCSTLVDQKRLFLIQVSKIASVPYGSQDGKMDKRQHVRVSRAQETI